MKITSTTVSSTFTVLASHHATVMASCKLRHSKMVSRKTPSLSKPTMDPPGKSLGLIPSTKVSSRRAATTTRSKFSSVSRTTVGAKFLRRSSALQSIALRGHRGSTVSFLQQAQLREQFTSSRMERTTRGNELTLLLTKRQSMA
jgi:hypothetical protein